MSGFTGCVAADVEQYVQLKTARSYCGTRSSATGTRTKGPCWSAPGAYSPTSIAGASWGCRWRAWMWKASWSACAPVRAARESRSRGALLRGARASALHRRRRASKLRRHSRSSRVCRAGLAVHKKPNRSLQASPAPGGTRHNAYPQGHRSVDVNGQSYLELLPGHRGTFPRSGSSGILLGSPGRHKAMDQAAFPQSGGKSDPRDLDLGSSFWAGFGTLDTIAVPNRVVHACQCLRIIPVGGSPNPSDPR
jgi:hypothetical protein